MIEQITTTSWEKEDDEVDKKLILDEFAVVHHNKKVYCQLIDYLCGSPKQIPQNAILRTYIASNSKTSSFTTLTSHLEAYLHRDLDARNEEHFLRSYHQKIYHHLGIECDVFCTIIVAKLTEKRKESERPQVSLALAEVYQ